MRLRSMGAIYQFELLRSCKAPGPNILSPVLSVMIFLLVFGLALGEQIAPIKGVSYGAYLVPGLLLCAVMTDSLTGSAMSIFAPKLFGATYETLSAPLSGLELVLAYVAAAVTKSMIIGTLALLAASVLLDFHVTHPLCMAAFLLLASLTFSFLGFAMGVWADRWERLASVNTLLVTPLVFLSGCFFSLDVLPPPWRTIALLNPLVYFVIGFRWSFFGVADIAPGICFAVALMFLILCGTLTTLMVRAGYKLTT